MKKIVTVCLALVLALVGFSGCIRTTPKEEVKIDQSQVNLDIPSDITETLKIGITGEELESNLITELAKGFKKLYPNVTVQTEILQGASYNNMVTYYYNLDQEEPGTMPDILWSNSTDMFALIDTGIFLDMDAFIAAEKERNAAFTDDFYASIWKLGQKNYDGAQYLIPRTADRVVCHYNKDIFLKAGVSADGTVPLGWTWDDFLSACEKIRTYFDNHNKANVAVADAYLQWDPVWYAMMRSNGAKIFDESGEIAMDSAEMRTTLAMMRNLIDKKYVGPSNGTAANFENGNGAILFHSAPAKRYYDVLGDKYAVTTFPLIGDTPKIGSGVPGYGIYAYTKKYNLAWAFLKFVTTKDGQECLAKGGSTQPSIRTDMADPATNVWGAELFEKGVNMAAYTYKTEYNQPTDFFLGHSITVQSKLLSTLNNMISEHTSSPSFYTADQAISRTINSLNKIIGG